MLYEFVVGYAPDKDSMGAPPEYASVHVEAETFVEARLIAEQMVAAMGVEPVSIEEDCT